MFAHYVCEGVFCWRECEHDVFDDLYFDGDIGDYKRDSDFEPDYDNAWEYWANSDGFWQWLTNEVKEYGFVDYDKHQQNGTFMWIQAEEMLVVCPDESDTTVELPTDIVATFDRDSLYETEYAEGIVKDGVFYATTIARELD